MSSYMILDEVSKGLQLMLWQDFQRDETYEPTLRQYIATREAIVFQPPKRTNGITADGLSIWLYQICEDEFVKNQPLQRGPTARNGGEDSAPSQLQRFPPLALNLYYLITPFAQSDEGNHLLLGKTMQVLYDNAIVLLRNPANGAFEELRIILCRLALEEQTRIWEALQEPYRLSVCYKVRVARVDSLRELGGRRVIERTNAFRDAPEQ
jgi:hypothetical protein